MTKTFHNPLKPEGADPWIQFHDGVYSMTYTTGVDLRITQSPTLEGLKTAPETVVWQDETPSRCTGIWAPEFYRFETPDGPRWYGYYTAFDGIDDRRHRMHVIESDGEDILGPYHYKAKLQTDPQDEYYAIDGTVVVDGQGRRHLVWAGHPDHVLFIDRLTDPWTLAGRRTYLPADGFGCVEVREGPVALYRGGRIFLIYSICDTGKPDYKLGMLIADQDSDLTDAASWRQHPSPVFTRCDEHGVYGPGHNHFFQSPDGTEDWIIYHAKATAEYTYAGRSSRAQRFTWTPEGLPDFGVPLSLETAIPAPSGE